MDIIVTTPKGQMKNAAQEAEDVKAHGAGFYFRDLATRPQQLAVGERVYYVEDGYVRGFAIVHSIEDVTAAKQCDTTGIIYQGNTRIHMDATSWCWIKPIKMAGFQSWRYAKFTPHQIQIVGGWKDKRP